MLDCFTKLQKFRNIVSPSEWQRQLMGSSSTAEQQQQQGDRQEAHRKTCNACGCLLGPSGVCPSPECQQRRRAADSLGVNVGSPKSSPRGQGESTLRTGHSSVWVDEASLSQGSCPAQCWL